MVLWLQMPGLQAFTQMHLSETRSEEIYKIVTQKYPKSVKILRAYVRYYEASIKLNCWGSHSSSVSLVPHFSSLSSSLLPYSPLYLLHLCPLYLSLRIQPLFSHFYQAVFSLYLLAANCLHLYSDSLLFLTCASYLSCRFLREIKNDPWKAQKYDLLADNYEQVTYCMTCR